MIQKKAALVDDPPLTIAEVAARWRRNKDVTLRMLKKAGAPLMRLTSKTVRVRLSVILQLERDAEVTLPHGYQRDFPGRIEREKAKKLEATK